MPRLPLNTKQAGLSLIELVGATVIFSIMLIGAMNHLVLTRALSYHTQIKSAVVNNLTDTLMAHQTDSNGTNLVSVPTELLPYVPAGVVTTVKSPTQITGCVVWTSVIGTNSSMTYTSTASLTLVPTP